MHNSDNVLRVLDLGTQVAGPFATEPSAILNLLPWHGQAISPSATVLTVQPWWVQTALKALY